MNRPHPRAALRGVLSLVAFAAAFAAGCRVIGGLLPFPEVPVVQPKLEYLGGALGQHDTLFVGSSRIYNQVMPSVFDEATAAAGRPTRSFNAGVSGMRPPEDCYLLERILDSEPRNLRWVFVELGALRLPVDREKRGTVRALYWHDWERVALLARFAMVPAEQRTVVEAFGEMRAPIADFGEHAALFARRFVNFGRGSALTEMLGRRKKREIWWPALGENRDGYLPVDGPQSMPETTREFYRTQMAARRRKPAVADHGDPVSQEALSRVIRRIRDAGATPVLVAPPTTAPVYFHPNPDNARLALVIDFTSVEKYPALYAEENRLDHAHLNASGARLFSRLLAEELLRAGERATAAAR